MAVRTSARKLPGITRLAQTNARQRREITKPTRINARKIRGVVKTIQNKTFNIQQITMAKKTNTETQAEFDKATANKYPHFIWLPPEWKNGDPKPTLEDTVGDAPKFTLAKHPLNCVTKLTDRIEELRKTHTAELAFVQTGRGFELLPNTAPTDPLIDLPHPQSDVSHVDPVMSSADKKDVRDAIANLEGLKGKASKDGELADAFNQALVPLGKAKELCFEDPNDPKKLPKGMQRLRLVFEFMLSHTTALFGEMNEALKNDDQDKYVGARNEYLKLLADWDDHEPQTVTPGEHGYGSTIKWSYIYPLIHLGKIKGAKVISKWNPHLSSSGIPIPHL